ncbi:zinc finger protein 318 [Pungitius pungitius]|uniref:zinc finger protein 318 n=1 Tax=Pungitius pungitius TaxID=134920 RepID=UPI002E0D4828
MYRGRPPPSGGYGQPLEGRGLPPPRPYPVPGYRDDRNRPRPPFHPGFHEQGHPDSYHRSPPRRRYPSPGLGHRGGEYWSGRPTRERSQSPRGSGPIDHNLVITVGNELTGPSGSAASRHHDREYPRQPEYERSRARSPDRSRAKSQGRSKSRARSQSRSPDRSRAKSRGRSKSRSPDRSRAKSRGRSRSRSPDRSRAKSRGRSRSRSPDQGRSRSRPRSRSRGRSQRRSKSRQRSRTVSSSSSSSSSSGDNEDVKTGKGFKELETARRRKELEEMLSLPTKSILKKRTDSEDSPSLKNNDSPRGPEGSNISRVADQLLLAVKGMEPHMVASMLSELRADPQMAQRAGLDAEIKEILHLLGGAAQEKMADDIDDEEKFLYGDSQEPKPPVVSEPVRHHGLDLYGEVTEEALYGDPQKHVPAQNYSIMPAASSHLQAPPTEVEMRYASRPPTLSDQNLTVQVLNSSSLPGMEPLEESDRQALEEYEKIQDLLKTIGLDLGVTEISKMAARTKERLHGNKPPPKTPTRSRRYSSASSDGSRGGGRRSHSSSSTSSRSGSRGRGGRSWSSDGRKSSAPHKDANESTSGQSAALPPPPSLPGVPIPPYPPAQVHGLMPPNFPPPGYSQYGNYLPYMPQQWPPMYPPPTIAVPPQVGLDEFPPAPPYQQHYGIPAPEPGAKAGSGPTKTCEAEKGKVSRVSEEQNNESQKQKVLEEREKLKQERDVRMKKKEYLMKELERLRKQQGELLRKKRREKGGHKDPLLQEISHLQEEVMAQISNLRKEHEAAEKNRNEIEKIALILGLLPSDRPRRTGPLPEDPPPPEKKKCEAQSSCSSSTTKTSAPGASPDEPPGDAPPPPDPFEYYDAGNHWCKSCNVTSGSMFDYFTHLHSKTHRKTLDPYDRPWASTPTKILKNLKSEEKLTKPAKGSEFLRPVRGFFCLLCKQFYGDAICAEEHVTTHAHNNKYKKQMYENPLYEQRRNLDRQAGLGSETSGKKRKHEDGDQSNKDEKSKHKKEKREKKDEEPNVAQEEKIKKEEEEAKPSKRTEELKKSKSLEVARPSPEEKFKGSRKAERHRSSREEEEEEEDEEERGKHSRKEDQDRCKHREEEGRRRYRREEKDRYDGRPKHALHSDLRSKRNEEKLKEASKKPEAPPKPFDPPKVLCGPSPAMRAKLRKQSLEPGRPPPPAAAPSFGKFTWKRKENVLAKEAEKVAAEFIKEDEAAAGGNAASPADSFARSMAVAKEIADKLGGHSTPPPWAYNRGRIRPNLPAPAAVLRKTTTAGKPAPLNTFLSIQNAALAGLPPPPETHSCSDGLMRALTAQNTLLQNTPPPAVGNPAPSVCKPPPPVCNPAPSVSKPPPPVCNPAPSVSKPPPPVCNPAPSVSKPPPPVCNPAPSVSKPPPAVGNPAPSVSKPPPPVCNPAPSVSKPPPPVCNPAPSVSKPPPPVCNPAPSVSKPPPPVCNPAPSVSKPPPPVCNPAPSVSKPPPPVCNPAPSVSKPPPPVCNPAPSVSKPPPPVCNPAPSVSKPPPPVCNPAPSVSKPPPPVCNPAPSVSKPPPPVCNPAPSVSKPPPPVCNSAPSVSKPPPIEAKFRLPETAPASPVAKPAPPSMIKIVSDVAAPGVPEGEQTRTVFVKPPPFMNMGDGPQKPEKLRSNLAAAKAQDLFNIFYSRVDQSGASSITKPAADASAAASSTTKSCFPTPQAPKTQPQLLTPPQPPPEVPKAPPPGSPSPQTQQEPVIQIESVWSLQPAPRTETPLGRASPVQPDDHSGPQNQISTPTSPSQTKPAELEPTPQIPTDGQPDRDTQSPLHLETPPDTAPEHAPKPSPRTRGKRTPPAPRPVRQTRSQTRYQTRQQSQSEPEPALSDSDSVGLEPKGPDPTDPGPGVLLEGGAPSEGDPPVTEITSETLGLPADMTSLDFDYNFNFE